MCADGSGTSFLEEANDFWHDLFSTAEVIGNGQVATSGDSTGPTLAGKGKVGSRGEDQKAKPPAGGAPGSKESRKLGGKHAKKESSKAAVVYKGSGPDRPLAGTGLEAEMVFDFDVNEYDFRSCIHEMLEIDR
jgi:hypothetical protein